MVQKSKWQGDQKNFVREGTLLHFAVAKDLKEHVRVLLQLGFALFQC